MKDSRITFVLTQCYITCQFSVKFEQYAVCIKHMPSCNLQRDHTEKPFPSTENVCVSFNNASIANKEENINAI